jgi:hypothetical protein
MRAPDGGGVGRLRVGGEVVGIGVAAGGQHHRIRQMRLQGARYQVSRDHAAGPAVHHDEVEHLPPRQHGHAARRFLLGQRAIGAQEELLAGLPARVEGPRDQGAAEGAAGEVAAVLAGEGHPLGHRVVDDARGELGEPVDAGLARAEVAALERLVEEPPHAVPVVLVVLGGVDPALGGHAVRAPGGVVEDQAPHAIAQLGQRRRRGGAREPGADHQHGVEAPARRSHQRQLIAMPRPPGLERAGRNARIERRHRSHPASTASGTDANPSATAADIAATCRAATPARAVRPDAQAPRRRPEPVEEVKAQQQRGPRVDRGDHGGAQAEHHVGVHVTRVKAGVAHPPREVEQVVDDEGEQQHTACPHAPGGPALHPAGGAAAGPRLPPRARRAVGARERHHARHVHDRRGGEAGAHRPQGRRDASQGGRVAVRGLGPGEHREVPGHVEDHPEPEEQPRGRHQGLPPHRRAPEPEERVHAPMVRAGHSSVACIRDRRWVR